MTIENTLKNELLEILNIIAHDGNFNDIESVEELLLKVGVSQETIDYHKR